MSRRSNRRWTHQYKCRQEQKKILVISSLRVEMVSHPPSHSGVRQDGEYGHNICLPSVVGHPATSSAPTRRSQQQLGLKERELWGAGFLAGSLTYFCAMSGHWTGSRQGSAGVGSGISQVTAHATNGPWNHGAKEGKREGRWRWTPKGQSREVTWPLAAPSGLAYSPYPSIHPSIALV